MTPTSGGNPVSVMLTLLVVYVAKPTVMGLFQYKDCLTRYSDFQS